MILNSYFACRWVLLSPKSGYFFWNMNFNYVLCLKIRKSRILLAVAFVVVELLDFWKFIYIVNLLL